MNKIKIFDFNTFVINDYKKSLRIKNLSNTLKFIKSWIPFSLYLFSISFFVNLICFYNVNSAFEFKKIFYKSKLRMWVLNFYLTITMLMLYFAILMILVSNPKTVSKATSKYYFKNDQLIFFENNICTTCNLIKPPRSKHCSICNECYLFYDHHCYLINKCIGYNNYKWFILFTIANINFLGCGIYLSLNIIIYLNEKRDFDFLKMIKFNDFKTKLLIIIFFLSTLFFILTLIFFAFNIYYIYLGITLNELKKWLKIGDLIKSGNLYELKETSINNEIYLNKIIENSNEKYVSLKNQFIFIDEKNEKNYNLKKVKSINKEIVNIYDQGFYKNFKERVFVF